MPSKRPEPNIPEDILEQPIMDNQRARSFTDSEGFYEEVSFYPLFSQLGTVKIANFEDNSINVLKEHWKSQKINVVCIFKIPILFV